MVGQRHETFANAGRAGDTHKKYEALNSSLETRKREEKQLDTIQKKYILVVKASSKDPEKLKKLKVINSTIAALKREIDRIISDIGKLKHQMTATRDADITVLKRAYPNVHLNINDATFQIRQESKGGKFTKFGSDIRWGS